MENNSTEPPKSAIEPEDTYPDRITDAIAMLRDEPKDSPDKFIGRRQELQTVMSAIHASIPSKRREGLQPLELGYQPGVLQTIIGGPGAGKTSLLKAFEDECRHHQCRVIRLQDDDLDNPGALTNAIREKCHWRDRDRLTTLEREVASTTAASTAAVATGWVRRLVRVLGGTLTDPSSGLEAENVQPARAVLRCWQRNAPADPTDVLRLLSKLGPTVLTIDEAHQLDRYRNTDRTETARTVIRTLATPEARHDADVKNCFMVVAGLNDLHPTITELGAFRQTPLQLGAFQETDVTAILEHWIDRARAPTRATERAKEQWVPTLARAFGEWPYQTIAVGMGARTMLEVDPIGATTSSWGIRAVREIGEKYKNQYFGYVMLLATQQRNSLETILAVAHRMHEAGGTLTRNQLEVLTAATLEMWRQQLAEAEPTAPNPTSVPDTLTAVRTMLRAGILEYADIDRNTKLPSRLRIAIPSLGNHLRSIPMEPDGPATRALAQIR